MTRRALVLSGGGAKGSFQIGAMEELILNRGLDFEILCGVSVGALNASFLAQAPFDPIHKVLKKVRFAPIIEIKPEKYIIRDALDFSPANLMENYQYGRKVAASLSRSLP